MSCRYPSCMMGGGCSYEYECIREEQKVADAVKRAEEGKKWNVEKELEKTYEANR